TSSASPRGTVAIGSSVAGFTTVKVPVPADPTHLPSMKIVSRSITVVSLTRTPSAGTGVRSEGVRIYELIFIITIKSYSAPRRRSIRNRPAGRAVKRLAAVLAGRRAGATDRGNEITRDW